MEIKGGGLVSNDKKIQQLLEDAQYYAEQAVFDRHTASVFEGETKEYYDSQAERHEKMSQKRRAEARRLARE